MIKGQTIAVQQIKWDRSVRRGLIRIGETKSILDISSAPLASNFDEIFRHFDMVWKQGLGHSHVILIKLFDGEKTIERITDRASSASIDSKDYSAKNRYLNDVLRMMVVIVDPALDSLKYLLHTRNLATGKYVQFDIRKIANRIESLHVQKKKKKFASDAQTYASKIDEVYTEFFNRIMNEKDHKTLLRIITETLRKEFECQADIGLPPVPIISSDVTFEFAKLINQFALEVWPKNESHDNCATYLILSPEVLSNEDLVKKIISYIDELETKVLVLKIKNLKLEEKNKSDETDAFRNICEAIIRLKQKRKDTVAVLLEANTAMFPAAASGFDIVSTSQVGMDDEKPFQIPSRKNTINGYFDPVKLFHRNDQYIRKALQSGGFKHKGCICSTLTDYPSAKRDWPDIKRRHLIQTVDELYEKIYQYAGEGMIEQVKIDLAKSRISNYRQALPLTDHV